MSAELGLTGEIDTTWYSSWPATSRTGVAAGGAPTIYLVGLAAGAAGGGPEAVRAATERVTELVRRWPAV